MECGDLNCEAVQSLVVVESEIARDFPKRHASFHTNNVEKSRMNRAVCENLLQCISKPNVLRINASSCWVDELLRPRNIIKRCRSAGRIELAYNCTPSPSLTLCASEGSRALNLLDGPARSANPHHARHGAPQGPTVGFVPNCFVRISVPANPRPSPFSVSIMQSLGWRAEIMQPFAY